MHKKQIAVVILLTAIVAIIHSFIPEKYLALHIIFRLLYFIPIVLAALSTGRKGGLITSFAISLIFLPHFFFVNANSEFIAGNAVAIVLFNLCGLFVGSFRESTEVGLVKRLQQEQVVVPSRDAEQQRVLFYIDGSPLSLSTAQWLGNRYDLSKMSVVLLQVITQDREEILADTLAGKQGLAQDQVSAMAVNQIKQALIDAGMDEETIEKAAVTVAGKVPISEKIVEYLNDHEFDFLLLCKHNKKKSEEFLFGDTAIQVLRKTSTPMLIVKGIEEQPSQV